MGLFSYKHSYNSASEKIARDDSSSRKNNDIPTKQVIYFLLFIVLILIAFNIYKFKGDICIFCDKETFVPECDASCKYQDEKELINDPSKFEKCSTETYSNENIESCVLQMVNLIRAKYNQTLVIRHNVLDDLAKDLANSFERQTRHVTGSSFSVKIIDFQERARNSGLQISYGSENYMAIPLGSCTAYADKMKTNKIPQEEAYFTDFYSSKCTVNKYINEGALGSLIDPNINYAGIGVATNDNIQFIVLNLVSYNE